MRGELGLNPLLGIVCIAAGKPTKDPVWHQIPASAAWPWQVIVVVIGVKRHAPGDLSHVVLAYSRSAGFFGLVKRRKHEAGEDRYDPDDHHEFNQGETNFPELRCPADAHTGLRNSLTLAAKKQAGNGKN